MTLFKTSLKSDHANTFQRLLGNYSLGYFALFPNSSTCTFYEYSHKKHGKPSFDMNSQARIRTISRVTGETQRSHERVLLYLFL